MTPGDFSGNGTGKPAVFIIKPQLKHRFFSLRLQSHISKIRRAKSETGADEKSAESHPLHITNPDTNTFRIRKTMFERHSWTVNSQFVKVKWNGDGTKYFCKYFIVQVRGHGTIAKRECGGGNDAHHLPCISDCTDVASGIKNIIGPFLWNEGRVWNLPD